MLLGQSVEDIGLPVSKSGSPSQLHNKLAILTTERELPVAKRIKKARKRITEARTDIFLLVPSSSPLLDSNADSDVVAVMKKPLRPRWYSLS